MGRRGVFGRYGCGRYACECTGADSWLDLTALPQTDFENTSIYSTCMDFGKFSSGEGFDSVSVLGDSSVTVGTLFSMLFDTYSWETGDAMEAIVRDAVCQLETIRCV